MGKAVSKAVEKAKEAHAHRLTLVSLEASTTDAAKASEICKRVVKDMPRLEKLAINKSQLVSLPTEIAQFNNLVLIDLEENQLRTLPDDCLPVTLKEAFMAKNRLAHLPNALVRCSGLTALDLHANDISVPQLSAMDRRKQTVFDFPMLNILNLAENRLEFLPAIAWANLRQIQRIVLDNNQLKVFPSQLCLLASLQTLSISSNVLVALPEEISALTSLTELDVGTNALDALPAGLRLLTRLKTLDVRSNRLQRLPVSLAALGGLSRLFAQANQLTEVPPELGRLPLTMLHLQENQIGSVPSELFLNTVLVELLLDHNRLAALPSDIRPLPRLSKLHLNHNQLAELPDELRHLTALTVLLLDHNALKSVPVALLEMNVMRLSLNDNPMDTDVQSSIRAKGALSVIKQARSQFAQDGPAPATPGSPPTASSFHTLTTRVINTAASRSSSPGAAPPGGSPAAQPAPPPPYEEWRLAFEAFLAQMGLTRSDELTRMSVEQKWLLLQTWRKGEAAQHLIGETLKGHRRSASTGGQSTRQQCVYTYTHTHTIMH